MEIVATLNYPYQFLIKQTYMNTNPNGVQRHTIDEIRAWCKENCKGMYLTASDTYIKIYAPVQHLSPLTGEPFEPSSVSSSKCILIAFAEEEEAMAFKLTFENSVDIKK